DADNNIPTIITQPQTPPESAPAKTATSQPTGTESAADTTGAASAVPSGQSTASNSAPADGNAEAPATSPAEAAPATPPAQAASGATPAQATATQAAPAVGGGTTPAPTQTQVATAPGVHVWLSSQRSHELAERGWKELQTAYPDLLGKLELTVREVDLGAAKGVWYRVYAGPFASKQEAKDLCAKIKAKPPNSNCLVAAD